jgi:hypothetical protein
MAAFVQYRKGRHSLKRAGFFMNGTVGLPNWLDYSSGTLL